MINCFFSVPKTVCANTLQRLGVENDVELLLRRVGIKRFLYKHVPSYVELTYEFWSSLNFEEIEGSDE